MMFYRMLLCIYTDYVVQCTTLVFLSYTLLHSALLFWDRVIPWSWSLVLAQQPNLWASALLLSLSSSSRIRDTGSHIFLFPSFKKIIVFTYIPNVAHFLIPPSPSSLPCDLYPCLWEGALSSSYPPSPHLHQNSSSQGHQVSKDWIHPLPLRPDKAFFCCICAPGALC